MRLDFDFTGAWSEEKDHHFGRHQQTPRGVVIDPMPPRYARILTSPASAMHVDYHEPLAWTGGHHPGLFEQRRRSMQHRLLLTNTYQGIATHISAL